MDRYTQYIYTAVIILICHYIHPRTDYMTQGNVDFDLLCVLVGTSHIHVLHHKTAAMCLTTHKLDSNLDQTCTSNTYLMYTKMV